MNAQKSCGCGCATLTCGCCEGVDPLTPEVTANRPGLASLSYRAGNYGSFFETMSARLSLHELAGGVAFDGSIRAPSRPLASLGTRDGADASMALLDAWASVGDVLTFYQERIVNEGYLRTATELRSVYELARLVGYRPRPGVAASVYLAYTIDNNTAEEVTIPRGARSQSVPGPGEFPQAFETGLDLRARARWNDLKLRLEQPQRVETLAKKLRVYLKGINTGLVPGDPLMIAVGSKRIVVRVTEVLPDNDKQRTLVRITPWGPGAPSDPLLRVASLQPLEEVLSRAPQGATATTIVDGVHAVMRFASEAAPGDALPRARVRDADEAIASTLDALSLPAATLRAWAGEVREALKLAVRADDDEGSQDGRNDMSVAELVSGLARAGSRPLANALNLPRSLSADFSLTSDAGLKLLGAVAPEIRASLGPTLAGQTDPDAAQALEVYAFRVRAGLFGRNAPKQQQIRRGDPAKTEIIGEWPIVEMSRNPNNDGAAGDFEVTAIHETPQAVFLDTNYEGIVAGSWAFIDSSAVVIDPAALNPSPLVFPAGQGLVMRVRGVHAKISRSEYGISGDTVRLDIEKPWLKIAVGVGDELQAMELQPDIDRDFRVIRGTAVFARSEKLELALEPIEKDFCGGSDEEEPAELDGLYPDLEPGRFVIVSGERADLGDGAVVPASEALMVRAVRHDVRVAGKPVPWNDEVQRRIASDEGLPDKLPDDRPHTFVWFDKPMSYCYRRATVSIRANVVKATHGETRIETLGNGDGAKSLQGFALKQFPLTYLAAATASGADSTLQVFVNDVRWYERTSFVMTLPTERIFVTKADEQGKTTVIFGNGVEGARLPTGAENVKAVYRNGIGKPGNVRAGQISQLSTRPLGVKDVVNPLRASGGADAETRDQARRNTPNAVMALDRLVSTRDYADFARAFAGIGKAAAIELPDGARSVVHVTIAGSDDIPIDPGSDLYLALRRALRKLGDPFQPLALATRELLILVAAARVRIDEDRRWEVVAAEIRARLLDAFGFARRDLAQGVASSEVLAAIQSVRGVAYVDLDSFGTVPATVADALAEGGRRPSTPEEISNAVQQVVATSPPLSYVNALPARTSSDGFGILPAQLAILLPDATDTLVLNRIE